MKLSLYELVRYCNSKNFGVYSAKMGVSVFDGDALCVNNNHDALILLNADGERLEFRNVKYATVSNEGSVLLIKLFCDHFLAEGGRIECQEKSYEVIAK